MIGTSRTLLSEAGRYHVEVEIPIAPQARVTGILRSSISQPTGLTAFDRHQSLFSISGRNAPE